VQRSFRLNALSLQLGAAGAVLTAFAAGRLGPFEAAAVTAATVLLAAHLAAGRAGRRLRPGVDGPLLWAGVLDGAGTVAWFAGLALLGPVPLALLGGLSPVVAAGLAWVALGERLGPGQLAAGAASVAGALLFSWRDGVAVSRGGLALALGATVAFAASNLLCAVALRRRTPEEVLVGSRRWSLVSVVVAGLAAGRLGAAFDPGAAALVAAGALLGSWLAVRLLLEALREAGLSVTTVVRAAAPVATAAVAWPFFPVPLTPLNLAGGALLVASVAWLGLGTGGGRAGREG
jgi:drug/metabolite transporter (DMT)-like permease